MEVPPWVSLLCFILKKTKTIRHLGLSRSPENECLRLFESKYAFRIFLYELFSFYKKVSSTLDHFFFEIFYCTTPPPTQMIFYLFLLVNNRTV